MRAERAAGRLPTGAARILAAWIGHLRGVGAPVDDAGAGRYRDGDVLSLLAPDLAADTALAEEVARLVRHLT